MEPYADINGDSGIAEFKAGDNFIRVKFKDGGVYLYTYSRPGRDHVERMKSLAAAGHGLNSYINRYVRKSYEAREV